MCHADREAAAVISTKASLGGVVRYYGTWYGDVGMSVVLLWDASKGS